MKKNITILVVALLCVGIFFLQFQYQRTYQPHTYYQVYLDDQIIGVITSKDELEEHISKQGTLIRNQVLDYQKQLEILDGVQSIYKKIENNIAYKNYLSLEKWYDNFSQLVDEFGYFDSSNRAKVQELVQTMQITDVVYASDHMENYELFSDTLDEKLRTAKAEVMDYITQNQEAISLSESETYYLEQYFENHLEEISYVKEKYMEDYISKYEIYLHAEDIYSPLGIYVERINSYHIEVSPVEEVYEKIISEKPCTIEGYQFRIKKQEDTSIPSYSSVGGFLLEDYETIMTVDSNDVIVYVTDEEIFRDAIKKLEVIYAGTTQFEKYEKGTQEEIKETGSRIDDVYIAEDITYKKINISVGETIYSDADELSSYLLYGGEKKEKTVYATGTDTVLSLAYKYGISVEEFFLSNPTFTSVNNLFYEGQPISIVETNPQVSVVVEEYVVEDKVVNYNKVERYDSQLNDGMVMVTQKGVDGLERVYQNVRRVNGAITFINPENSVTLKSPTDEITSIGTKVIPNVGSLSSWYWPTKKGYSLSSYYGWRPDPFGSGKRTFHSGLDISGTGMGSPVYASNNGTVYAIKDDGKINYGQHIIINHNNGYYTLYGHLSAYARGLRVGATVSRGDIIGYVGSTGASTGPHLHFEIRTCSQHSCTTNPLPYLRK